MPSIHPSVWLLLLAVVSTPAPAAQLQLASGAEQTKLLELYTSEGCSSCPPADRWLSRLKTDARLWRDVVPVAFHVDYWNGLGWSDRFSAQRYTQRQYRYRQHRLTSGVYTPGFIYNGHEWRGWFNGDPLPVNGRHTVGVLKATLDRDSIRADFSPLQGGDEKLVLNIAWLAFNQSTVVKAGENNGRTLKHDFVVVDFRQYAPARSGPQVHWSVDGLPSPPPGDADAIAMWVSRVDDPTPIQAVGGRLPAN